MLPWEQSLISRKYCYVQCKIMMIKNLASTFKVYKTFELYYLTLTLDFTKLKNQVKVG